MVKLEDIGRVGLNNTILMQAECDRLLRLAEQAKKNYDVKLQREFLIDAKFWFKAIEQRMNRKGEWDENV